MKTLLFILLFPAWLIHARTSFDTKIKETAAALQCPVPDEQHPVRLNAALVVDEDSMAVVVKVAIAPGWHIYDYVPPNLPYIVSAPVLKLPDGIRPAGSWEKTESSTSAMDPGVLIYEKEAVFIHKAVRTPRAQAGGTIEAGLYYQTCNIRQCLPPKEKTFHLKYGGSPVSETGTR